MSEPNGNGRCPSIEPHNSYPNETRIDILDMNPSTSMPVHPLAAEPSTSYVPQNISSILHQARDQFNRQTENSRICRLNFNNVFQGVQPLVQTSQYNRNFRSWAVHPNNNQNNSNNIEVNLSHIQYPRPVAQHDINSLENHSDNSLNNNNTRFYTRPERPILDRVASLTRNDPPNLIETSDAQRQRQQQGNEDGAIADVISQVPPEGRPILLLFVRYLPFICILMIKSAYDHLGDLFNALSLLGIFLHVNTMLREQVAKHDQRRNFILIRETALILIVTFFRFFINDRPNTYYNFFLIRSIPDEVTLSQLLWSVIITDLILKLMTIIIKILITMLPNTFLHYRRKGRFYVLIESISQLYRALSPIQIWLTFLLESYSGMEKFFGLVLSSAYLVTKFFNLIDRSKFCKKALMAFPRKVSYGTSPTREELEKSERNCPICHDGYENPIKLECGHLFCEFCVETWFGREQTCPMCRAKVAEDLSWLDGATSLFCQIF